MSELFVFFQRFKNSEKNKFTKILNWPNRLARQCPKQYSKYSLKTKKKNKQNLLYNSMLILLLLVRSLSAKIPRNIFIFCYF